MLIFHWHLTRHQDNKPTHATCSSRRLTNYFAVNRKKPQQFFCSLDPRPHPTSDQESECDPEPDPGLYVSVPGPGFVLVSSDIEVRIFWEPFCAEPYVLKRSPPYTTTHVLLDLWVHWRTAAVTTVPHRVPATQFGGGRSHPAHHSLKCPLQQTNTCLLTGLLLGLQSGLPLCLPGAGNCPTATSHWRANLTIWLIFHPRADGCKWGGGLNWWADNLCNWPGALVHPSAVEELLLPEDWLHQLVCRLSALSKQRVDPEGRERCQVWCWLL